MKHLGTHGCHQKVAVWLHALKAHPLIFFFRFYLDATLSLKCWLKIMITDFYTSKAIFNYWENFNHVSIWNRITSIPFLPPPSFLLPSATPSNPLPKLFQAPQLSSWRYFLWKHDWNYLVIGNNGVWDQIFEHWGKIRNFGNNFSGHIKFSDMVPP